MRLYSADEEISVDVGTWGIWNSIYSTAEIILTVSVKKKISKAILFLKTGNCSWKDAKETKKQIIVLQKEFASLPPDRVVYDLNKPNMAPPWGNNIAPTVTSCANLYTTADGEDLFTEVIELLSYAHETQVDIFAG